MYSTVWMSREGHHLCRHGAIVLSGARSSKPPPPLLCKDPGVSMCMPPDSYVEGFSGRRRFQRGTRAVTVWKHSRFFAV